MAEGLTDSKDSVACSLVKYAAVRLNGEMLLLFCLHFTDRLNHRNSRLESTVLKGDKETIGKKILNPLSENPAEYATSDILGSDDSRIFSYGKYHTLSRFTFKRMLEAKMENPHESLEGFLESEYGNERALYHFSKAYENGTLDISRACDFPSGTWIRSCVKNGEKKRKPYGRVIH